MFPVPQVMVCAGRVLEELVMHQQEVLRQGGALKLLPMLPRTHRLHAINTALEHERGALSLGITHNGLGLRDL